MSERTQRRLAAVVAADVVGYSRLMGIDEEGTLNALREVRSDIVGPALAPMAERYAGVPEDRRIMFRVGINFGDVVADGTDLLGDGVGNFR